jgi:hypothetical protein
MGEHGKGLKGERVITTLIIEGNLPPIFLRRGYLKER